MVRKAYKLYQLGGVVSEILYSPAAYGLDMSAKNLPKPRGRISPQVSGVWMGVWGEERCPHPENMGAAG